MNKLRVGGREQEKKKITRELRVDKNSVQLHD